LIYFKGESLLKFSNQFGLNRTSGVLARISMIMQQNIMQDCIMSTIGAMRSAGFVDGDSPGRG